MKREIYGYITAYTIKGNDLTGSMHLACSRDGKTFQALNAGAGLLFPAIDTNDPEKGLCTGICFSRVYLFRKKEKGFRILAAEEGQEELYVCDSEDLTSYTVRGRMSWAEAVGELPGLVSEMPRPLVEELARREVGGAVLPEGAVWGNRLSVTRGEYCRIVRKFSFAADPRDERNLRQACGYPNPFIERRADPQIQYDPQNGCWYFTASYPALRDACHGYDRIILRRAESVGGLAQAPEITVWRAPQSGKMARHVWAPELHRILGKWYLFFAAGTSENIWEIRPYVLVCQGDDPFCEAAWRRAAEEPPKGGAAGAETCGKKGRDGKQADGGGRYAEEAADGGSCTGEAADGGRCAGEVAADTEAFEIHPAESEDGRFFRHMSLDMTYFEHRGRHYVIWADIIGQSALYMQEIDPEKPWKGQGRVIRLTTPEFAWERDQERVNEGAAVLKTADRIFVTFSASGTGPEYCIGLLWADAGAELMEEASWHKLGYPVLTSADVPGEYGPGHNSFTEDGSQNTLFVYHARPRECLEKRCGFGDCEPLYDPCRHARIRRVYWDDDGFPILKNPGKAETE